MMDEQNKGMNHPMMCKCPHHKMVPLMIALIGLSFLLGELGVLSIHAVNIIWPILVIIGAFTKMGGNNCKCCTKPM
jgi:hypothetical protein